MNCPYGGTCRFCVKGKPNYNPSESQGQRLTLLPTWVVGLRREDHALNLETIRAELLKERAELLGRDEAPVETARGDDADLAVMAEDKERELWLANDAKQRLELIDKALARIANGTYGKCINCGQPIPEERLRLLPLTLYDVACQSKLEKKTRR